MSIIDKIQQLLQQEKRKIIFYFDHDGSFKEELAQIAEAGMLVVEVNNNYFELKYRLEFEEDTQPIFLYHPFSKPTERGLRSYPLLDLLIANSELRLDDVSEFLSLYRLPDHHSTLIKRYIKQLKSKTNQRKLAKVLEGSRFSEASLKQGLISIVLDFNTVADRNTNMIKWLDLANDDPAFNKVNNTLIELDLADTLLNWFDQLIDFKGEGLTKEFAVSVLCKIKYNVLATFIDKPSKKDNYAHLKLERTPDINKLMAFFQDWMNNSNQKEWIEPLFNKLGEAIKISHLLEVYGTQQEFGYYTEEMLSVILLDLYKEVGKDPFKTQDDCIKWMRSPFLTKEYRHQIAFLKHASSLYIVLMNYSSFKFNTAEDFIEKYTTDLYRVDLNYRNAMIAFDKVRDYLYEFHDIAFEVFKTLNERYDRFLIELNVEWQQALKAKDFNFHDIKVDKQFDFYQKNLKDFEYKMVVIISDALRYELGYELYNELLADSKNNLSIEPSLASIPSYTNLGMTNLLPNKGIEVEKGDADLVFKINNRHTVSTNREAILKTVEPESATINYSEVIKFDRNKGRDYFKNNRIVYIYHDWIDAIGDKRGTEHEIFEATTKSVDDIKRLIQKLYGWNVYYVMVTADHGFLYNYNTLTENSREILPKTKGYVKEHVRFVVGEKFEGKVDGYVMDMKNTTNIDTDLKVAIPRAINRYRKQGNVGVQFVHGGGSMQELITPVIKYFKNRREIVQNVTFKRIDDTDRINSGSCKITLLQDQPVSNFFKHIDIILGLYSDSGLALSNEVELQINSTSENPKERIFEAILTLNTQGSKANFCYLKAFDSKDKSRLNPLGINDTVKISTTMEIDEF